VACCVLESVVLLRGTNLNAIYFVRYKAIHKSFVLDSVVMVGVLTKKSDIVVVAFVSSKALSRFGKVLG